MTQMLKSETSIIYQAKRGEVAFCEARSSGINSERTPEKRKVGSSTLPLTTTTRNGT